MIFQTTVYTTVLDMTLNCILVYDSITERFFRTPGPWTKYLSAFFLRSINIKHSSSNNILSLSHLRGFCNIHNHRQKQYEHRQTTHRQKNNEHAIEIYIPHDRYIKLKTKLIKLLKILSNLI